jgi:hypothetical protein
VQPALARQVAAALVMDKADLRFDSHPVRERFPALPCTTVADLLTADVLT